MTRRWLLAALLCAPLAALPASAQSGGGASALGSPEAPRQLIVTVHTRHDRGKVYCAIWRGREGYPTQREHNVGEARDITIRRHRATCVFEGVTPGEYAVAVIHDENGNDDLDRNIFGIPSEGTGASNDAHNMFGPPSYDDARFLYPDVRTLRIELHIHY